jgi:hypothetical protein
VKFWVHHHIFLTIKKVCLIFCVKIWEALDIHCTMCVIIHYTQLYIHYNATKLLHHLVANAFGVLPRFFGPCLVSELIWFPTVRTLFSCLRWTKISFVWKAGNAEKARLLQNHCWWMNDWQEVAYRYSALSPIECHHPEADLLYFFLRWNCYYSQS